MQKVLHMITEGLCPTTGLRSKAIGWSAEDGDAKWEGDSNAPFSIGTQENVGLIGPIREGYTFRTPLHAIRAGWKLLAPPARIKDWRYDPTDKDEYEWWFVKD